VFGRLPAGHDRLQEDRLVVLDERHEVHELIATHHEDALAGVALGVRVFQDVEQVTAFDVEHDILEADAALLP
jgi:hypothetical protein